MKLPTKVITQARLAIACIGLASALTVGAQTTSPPLSSTGSSGMTTSNADRRDDGFDWGWLGLLGLVGLVGMRRKDDSLARNRTAGTMR